jgi:predicted RNase H-like nuclease (RuvC/YqgF family)
MRRPSFRNVAELLEFVGEGKQGLLGYVESFSNPDSTLHFRLDEASREIARLQQQVRSLTESVDERDRMLQFTRKESLTCERLAAENREKILVNESLESEVILLRGECARTSGGALPCIFCIHVR